MPSSKARKLADLFGGSGDGGSIAPNLVSDLENTSTGAFDVPSGTTAERPSNPNTGYIRFNTTLDQLEQYTTDGWKGISAPPQISSVDVTTINTSDASQTFVITGQNFDNGATATLTDANGSTLTATSSTRNSSTQMTLVYSGAEFDAITVNTPEPLVVKVTNGSGIETKLEGVVGVDDNPIWSSPAANSNNTFVIDEASSITLSATDPETNGSISYSISSGTLPTGLSLSGSTISGTAGTGGASYTSGGVSSPITVTATGADGETTNRTFNIVRKWKDGSSASLAPASPQDIRDLGITTDGTYYLDPDGNGAGQFYCKFNIGGGNYGFALAMRYANPFFFGQLMFNRWDGHPANADGVSITTASSLNNGVAASKIPNSTSYVMLGWHDNITSAAPTDWVHTTIVGSPSSNTGFFATGSHDAEYSTSVIAYNVNGWSSTPNPKWHFRNTPPSGSWDGKPFGFGLSLSHNSNMDNTNNLLGGISDSCYDFTSQYGVSTIARSSETYVGYRKNIDGNGANGSYCALPSSGNNDGWTMWWR